MRKSGSSGVAHALAVSTKLLLHVVVVGAGIVRSQERGGLVTHGAVVG